MKRVCLLSLTVCLLFTILASAAWTTPEPVTEINTERAELAPFLSFDGKSLYFSRRGTDGWDSIYEATRPQPSGQFTSGSQVLSSSGHVSAPWVSPDNLRMYYGHEQSNTVWTINVSNRASVNDPWPPGCRINRVKAIWQGSSTSFDG